MKLNVYAIDPDLTPPKLILQISLYIITFLTISLAGSTYPLTYWDDWFRVLASGFYFSIPLMLILTAHEMGHYLMAVKYEVKSSLPWFIPFPTLFGTAGAYIRMKSSIPNRQALFDIGAAGPLAGFIVATIFILIGLPFSDSTSAGLDLDIPNIILGESLLFKFFSWLLLRGATDPDTQYIIHPTAFAGWVGYLVTFMNLMPVGQLDGGHVIYAMFGKKHQWFAISFFLLLLPLIFVFPGWGVWAILMLFLGLKHPAVFFDYDPLDTKRYYLGYCIMAVFVLTFMPTPFHFN